MPEALPQATPQVDLGAAFRGLTADPDWLKKYAVAGIVLLIPVLGAVIWFGWLRRVYDQAVQGQFETLPAMDLGKDLSYGVTPVLAVMNLVVPMLLVMGMAIGAMVALVMVGGAIDQGADGSGIGGVLTGLGMVVVYPLMFLVIILANLVTPELWRRGFNGETTPLLTPMPSVRAVSRRFSAYVMVLVGMFIANVVGSMGFVVCYVGVFLTMPMGMVIAMRLLAQWNAVVEHARLEAGDLAPTG